jgi:hypothetical protein
MDDRAAASAALEALRKFWGYGQFRWVARRCRPPGVLRAPCSLEGRSMPRVCTSVLCGRPASTPPPTTTSRTCDFKRRPPPTHQHREPQAAVISNALAGNDALVVMATGGGKSICYQVPPLVTGAWLALGTRGWLAGATQLSGGLTEEGLDSAAPSPPPPPCCVCAALARAQAASASSSPPSSPSWRTRWQR